MNKTTYERFKQEWVGQQMANAIEPPQKPQPVPGRVARRRMSKVWKRIAMGKVN